MEYYVISCKVNYEPDTTTYQLLIIKKNFVDGSYLYLCLNDRCFQKKFSTKSLNRIYKSHEENKGIHVASWTISMGRQIFESKPYSDINEVVCRYVSFHKECGYTVKILYSYETS